MASLSFVFLMTLFSTVSGFFVWTWHTEQLEKLKNHHLKKFKEGLNSLTLYSTELERLLLTAETKLTDQVKAAKDLSQQDVTQLLKKLTDFKEKLQMAIEPAPPAETGKAPKPIGMDEINKHFDGLRVEFDSIIHSLQFESKANHILTLVLTNLATIRETVEEVQQLDAQRKKKTLNVDGIMTTFQTQFESLKKDKRTTPPR